ncbi:MAG: CPBP family intramembrane glutamic endopeptidase [Myxococcota bacterium]|nr:CPBP family intramembrane glutamic endopeptidase [Myxococcota bacterium]
MFLGVVLPGLVMIPAEYLGVNPAELQGRNFRISVGTVTTILLFSAGSIGFVYLVQRYYHRRSLLDLGFARRWVGGLAWGHLIGALLSGLPLGLALGLAEDVQFSSTIPDSVGVQSLAGYFLFFLFMLTLNSFKEELLFRSYPIENMAGESAGNWTVILLASAIFSFVHLFLEPFTWMAFINRFLFGVFTCQVYVATRSLWPVVGIHNANNWVVVTFFMGEWRMGGFVSLTQGAEGVPFEPSPMYGIVSLALAVGLMVLWMQRERNGSVDTG